MVDTRGTYQRQTYNHETMRGRYVLYGVWMAALLVVLFLCAAIVSSSR